jgi:hypothetical protein
VKRISCLAFYVDYCGKSKIIRDSNQRNNLCVVKLSYSRRIIDIQLELGTDDENIHSEKMSN